MPDLAPGIKPEAPKHSHGRDCCWECFHGPDSHPKEPNDPMCEYENCPPPHALVEERDDASEPSVFDAAKDATARASEEQP